MNLISTTRLALVVLLVSFSTIPAVAQEDPTSSRGFEADQVYQLGDLDHVNIFNGNLLLTLPIGQEYPLGGGFSYRFSLVYNSNLWDFENFCEQGEPGDRCATIATPAGGFTAGAGWNLTLGRLLPPGTDLNQGSLWQFSGADGSLHGFYDNLHADDSVDAGVSYSRDGSYLRMKVVGSDRVVESPDGRRYTFELPFAGAEEWLLTSIADPYGTQLTVAYSPSMSSWDRWTVTDRYGRSHTIDFENGGAADFPKRISSVTLEAFGTADAVYDFSYSVHNVTRSCPHNSSNTPGTVGVPLLSSLTQPDGSGFSPSYSIPTQSTGCSENSARILGLSLPTKGRIDWTYQEYRYPLREDDADLPPPNSTRPPITTGVHTRTYKDRGGSVLAAWTYEPELEIPTSGSQPNEFRVKVTDPLGNWAVNYFSVDRDGAIYDSGDWNTFEYGLPFTRNQSVQATDPVSGTPVDLYLSTESYASNGDLRRTTWTRYEVDAPGPTPALLEWAQNLNRRPVAERTVYLNDGNFTEWFRKDFDGLGHHRWEHRTGSFLSGGGRTSFVNFNPGQGEYATDENGAVSPGFTMWSASSPWILGTSTFQYQTEDFQAAEGSSSTDGLDFGEAVSSGAAYSWIETDYDGSTGFLNCRRRLRVGTGGATPPIDARDVLEVFTPDAFGNVYEVEYYGGDETPLGGGGCGNPPSGQAEYRKRTVWEGGTLKRSLWVDDCSGGLALELADYDLDPDTGLVERSRDTTGYITEFTYDAMGRLLTSDPAEEASTHYTYTPAAGSNGSLVRIQQKDGAVVLTDRQLVFDDLGRLCKEVESRPSGWSRRMIGWNGRGWRTEQTEWVSAGGLQSSCESNLSGFDRTRYQGYDPFGRVGTVVAPDDNSVDFNYLGIRQIKRTAKVATMAVGQSYVETVERYDPFGRLRKVIEDFDGSQVTTSYAYEVNNNLRHVVQGPQERVFSWDKRGALDWEQHPELQEVATDPATGQIFYDRDTLGNVTRRDDGEHELRYLYDRAGRLTQLKDLSTSGRLLKEFFYHRNNRPGERSAGKLYQAKRHNYGTPVGPIPSFGISDLIVTETYEYSGRGGRVSKRTTSLASASARIFEQAFTYDALGNRQNLTYPSCLHTACVDGSAPNRTVTSTYDDGILTGVSGYATSLSYHPNGLLHQVHHANGMVDTQQADLDGLARPRQISTTGAQGTWSSGVYVYDGSANIRAIGSDTFLYDPLQRIVQSTYGSASGASQNYAYDDHGNLTSIVTNGAPPLTLSVDARTNRLNTATYDGAGNQLTNGSGAGLQQYQFDAINMLSTHQSTEGARGFVYTADDERLVEFDFVESPWKETWTLRDLDGRVLRQWEHQADHWTWLKDYVYRGPQLLASETRDHTHHFHLDHLGTPRLITDASGEVGRHTYFPFGEEITDSGQNGEEMKFTGHERDLGSAGNGDDLDYMHARYCSPTTGRFLSVDPADSSILDRPQSWNKFSYALNNPLAFVDPDGTTVKSALALIRNHGAEIVNASNHVGGRVTPLEIARLIFQENRNDLNLVRNDDDFATSTIGGPAMKNFGAEARFRLTGKHGTFGIAEMGTKVAARLMGMDQNNLSSIDKMIISETLNRPSDALVLAAKELDRIRTKFPEASSIQILNAYNRGDQNILGIGEVGLRSEVFLDEIRAALDEALKTIEDHN